MPRPTDQWTLQSLLELLFHTAHQGADNMALDVFLSSHPRGNSAFVIDTADDDGKFVESKIMLGFPSPSITAAVRNQ